MKKQYFTFFIGAFLTSCSAPPEQLQIAPFSEVPESWSSPADNAKVEQDWWLAFNDPRLTALINEALLDNPRLQQSDALKAQSQAQAKIAGADKIPSLSAALNSSRQQQPMVGGSGNTSSNRSIINEVHSASLNVSWEIDLWGRLDSLSSAAQADFLAAKQNFRAVQQSIAAQTAKAYFAVIEAQEQVTLSKQTVKIFTETARQITNRTDAGVVAPTDKLLAITNLETARAGLLQRENALQQYIRQLKILLGDYPSNIIETPKKLPSVPAFPSSGVPANLLSRRPDLLSAELNMRAAGLRLSASHDSLLPSITLTGSAGLQSNTLSDFLDGNFSVWSIAGQLVQPIFQGGRLRANIDFTEAQQQAAALAYTESVLNSFFEVENALASNTFLMNREAALLKASKAAVEAERIALNRYEQGVTLFLTVLESQQRALDTRSAFITARLARLNNRIDLHLALGGSFEATNE